jgi:hypothetical protein
VGDGVDVWEQEMLCICVSVCAYGSVCVRCVSDCACVSVFTYVSEFVCKSLCVCLLRLIACACV